MINTSSGQLLFQFPLLHLCSVTVCRVDTFSFVDCVCGVLIHRYLYLNSDGLIKKKKNLQVFVNLRYCSETMTKQSLRHRACSKVNKHFTMRLNTQLYLTVFHCFSALPTPAIMNSVLLNLSVFALLSIVSVSQAAQDSTCSAFVNQKVCSKKDQSVEIDKLLGVSCSAQYEGFSAIQPKIRQYINAQIIDSYQLTLLVSW